MIQRNGPRFRFRLVAALSAVPGSFAGRRFVIVLELWQPTLARPIRRPVENGELEAGVVLACGQPVGLGALMAPAERSLKDTHAILGGASKRPARLPAAASACTCIFHWCPAPSRGTAAAASLARSGGSSRLKCCRAGPLRCGPTAAKWPLGSEAPLLGLSRCSLLHIRSLAANDWIQF